MLARRLFGVVGCSICSAALACGLLFSAASGAADNRPKKGDNRPKKSAAARAIAKAIRKAEAKAAQKKAVAKKAAPRPAEQRPSVTKSAKTVGKAKTTPVALAATKTAKPGAPSGIESPLPNLSPVAPTSAATEADRLLASEIPALGTPSKAPRAGDEVYLRRISLDIAGRIPTAGEITAFALDPAPDKRAAAVERLLAEEAYGANWGRYWRDVIMYRRSEDRAMIVAGPLEEYLTKQFNANTSWDEIAHAFITATGDVRENGNTAVMMAQMGETSDITAEMSRIFTGIQIQCAQCHDHPTDRWQRTQFHELAAFFPRIGVRPKKGDAQQSFEVASVDRGAARRPNNGKPRPSLEHYMPDLQNPQAEGTRMEPIFFVTGQAIPLGTPDMERRETIAKWMTSPTNPWFAKAFVNRIWSELVGEGFYEPVDDIGPDRKATAPLTLDYLAAQFVANKHDIKWLFRTITATEAYQRASRSRRGPDETPMLAAAAQPLRGDQLYTTITSILGAPNGMQGPRPARYGNVRDPRFIFNAVFGFDPSVRRDDVTGSIPQALTVMNSPQLAAGMNGSRSSTFLGKLLADKNDDEAVAVELYLGTLSREPSAKELELCLAHVKQSGSRSEGFEDVLWALLNSAEFRHRK